MVQSIVIGSDETVSLSMPEITRLTPIGASFWNKLEGSIDAGFTYTHSSGIAQTNAEHDDGVSPAGLSVPARLLGDADAAQRRRGA